MNNKMKYIADEIGKFVYKNINNDYLESLFLCGFCIEDLIMQILFIECRALYLQKSEKHPLTFYIEEEIKSKHLDKDLNFEALRKQRERIIAYSEEKFMKFNKIQNSKMNRPDFDSKKILNNRFPSYDFSEFQYWEICNIHDMDLVKSIVDQKIIKKDFSNDRFQKVSNQYNNYFCNLVDECNSGNNIVINSIKYYTLESKYNFDFIYKLVSISLKESKQISNNCINNIKALACPITNSCILPNYTKLPNNNYFIEYPLILQRDRILNYFNDNFNNEPLERFIGAYFEANAIINLVIENDISIKEWMFKNIDLKDMKSFFEIFNAFRLFVPNKQWDKNEIKLAKKIYSEISFDYKKI